MNTQTTIWEHENVVVGLQSAREISMISSTVVVIVVVVVVVVVVVLVVVVVVVVVQPPMHPHPHPGNQTSRADYFLTCF